jgi:hypothetical protein
MKYIIYTSNGDFVFTRDQVDNNNFLSWEDYENSPLYGNSYLSVTIDFEKMFVFCETSSGDSAEYKIFEVINKPVETTNEQPLPSKEQLIEWIKIYKTNEDKDFKFFCPCELGIPFYPFNSCQCGG